MLFSLSRLKQSITTTKNYLILHKRLLFILFILLPFCSYLLSWLVLSTTSAFLPHPLKTAKEVLIVVAHPDDECTLSFSPTLPQYSHFLGKNVNCSSILFAEYSPDSAKWFPPRQHARPLSWYPPTQSIIN